jgi:riboflavin synthase
LFTGIIEHAGSLEAIERNENGARLTIAASLPDEPLVRGESIAVNGVCLTVLPLDERRFAADLSNETLSLTTLGSLAAGSIVNLERALRAGDRLGGHIVQGHVDATCVLSSMRNEGDFAVYRWTYPSEFADLLVPKGSIAVDGVSLTLVEPDPTSFGAALIPETLKRTNLGNARVGDAANLEFDVMAKYARQMLAPFRQSS